nr:MAG TPA: hypothetical protein [Caudoviricetes sp.]
MGRVGGLPVSQFTIDVLELAVKQGRAVTNSTMFSLAIAESSLNKWGPGKKSYDAAVVFAASMQPHLLDEWVRACYANEKPLSQPLVMACRRRILPRHTTADFGSSYKDLLLMQSPADHETLQIQERVLENLVAETYEILEKEKA